MEPLVRRFAVSSAAGAIAGLLWIGVLSRVAMAIIAGNNEHATSLKSDDGFIIGRFTLSGSVCSVDVVRIRSSGTISA